jgi:hypothetical protein
VDTRERGKYHRFHAFGLIRTVTRNVDEWYTKKHINIHTIMAGQFDISYSHLLSGDECCSSQTISFHYVEAAEHRALYIVRMALLVNPSMSDLDLKTLMMQHWPARRSEVGYYSQCLPGNTSKQEDVEIWTALLGVMRKISQPSMAVQC